MQVAMDSKRHSPRALCKRFDSVFTICRFLPPRISSPALLPQSAPVDANDHAINLARHALHSRGAVARLARTEFARQGETMALQPVIALKRSDGWKNVRNSSLSIA